MELPDPGDAALAAFLGEAALVGLDFQVLRRRAAKPVRCSWCGEGLKGAGVALAQIWAAALSADEDPPPPEALAKQCRAVVCAACWDEDWSLRRAERRRAAAATSTQSAPSPRRAAWKTQYCRPTRSMRLR